MAATRLTARLGRVERAVQRRRLEAAIARLAQTAGIPRAEARERLAGAEALCAHPHPGRPLRSHAGAAVDAEPALRAAAVAAGVDPEDVIADARNVLTDWAMAGLI